jgi:hypothetical protein
MGSRQGRRASRIKAADFWKEWIASFSRTTIVKKPIERVSSVRRTIGWMAKSVSKSMAKLSQVMPIKSVYDFCLYLIKIGTDKIRVNELEELRQWIAESGDRELLDKMASEGIG